MHCRMRAMNSAGASAAKIGAAGGAGRQRLGDPRARDRRRASAM